MKKKFFAVAMATTMIVGSAMSVSAELVTESTTFDGVVADGSAAWASGATGKTFPINADGVTIVFHNDAFTDSVVTLDGDKTGNPGDIWDNFVIETIASEAAKGVTMRADGWVWTYGDGSEPAWEVEKSWGEDWDKFTALTDDTDVTIEAKKVDDTTVTIKATFASDAAAYETYTLTYAEGVPADLAFQIGADGGIVTLKSATIGAVEGESSSTTPDEKESTTTTPDEKESTTTGSNTETTTAAETASDTGDAAPVAALAAMAVVASAAVVVSRKKVTE